METVLQAPDRRRSTEGQELTVDGQALGISPFFDRRRSELGRKQISLPVDWSLQEGSVPVDWYMRNYPSYRLPVDWSLKKRTSPVDWCKKEQYWFQCYQSTCLTKNLITCSTDLLQKNGLLLWKLHLHGFNLSSRITL